ncbi:hypothetical protein PsorP6_002787 [Peronosclerospora sorghi]|uniref:Uncharacterized protein n=1 Tax=Peronosclerospora sorghi TaxID=230839 RepID=A0ACC0VKZ8_9STRA|nr:hypothetical protein PsorP6_002787 [Peronosclerospora sorghi]
MLENNKGKEDEDDDEKDENFTAKDMDVIKRDLEGTSSATVLLHRAMVLPSATDAYAASVSELNVKAKGTATVGVDGANGKRNADDSRAKEDTPPGDGKDIGGCVLKQATETGVQQELIRYGGRMRTRGLLRKLKKLIVTDNDKAPPKDILRTICDVEVDAIDGRLLVLKSQFR